ncbi:MAG: peptidylprolyl isomerase [Cytophagales bacterium]|nr:MAG: peptidylprolyl isomerase [Cytophagales bacterium]
MLKNILKISAVAGLSVLASCGKKYETTPTGLKYLFYEDKEGEKAKLDDLLMLNFEMIAKNNGKDTVLKNTWKDGQPVPIVVQKSTFKGSLEEGLMMLSAGDSASFQVNADSIFMKTFGAMRPPFIDSASAITFNMKVIKIQSREDYSKEQQKIMEEKTSSQKVIDDKLIQDYIAQNNLTAQSTGSGLFYVISKPGKGPNAVPGKMVSVNYTGMLLDGTVFDSSTGRAPIEFQLGMGQVIPGWDEGLALLNTGAQAKLIIPSRLGYGPMQMSEKIPANSILIFDVELVKFK